jgi:hypothetical protein
LQESVANGYNTELALPCRENHHQMRISYTDYEFCKKVPKLPYIYKNRSPKLKRDTGKRKKKVVRREIDPIPLFFFFVYQVNSLITLQ